MADTASHSKLLSTGDFNSKIGGGKSNSGASDGRGSSRSYPHHSPNPPGAPSVNTSKFNPMNSKPSRYGVEGV